MKLIFCPSCNDVRKLHFEKTKCKCGKSYGWYKDNIDAVIGGLSIPIGFNNSSLYRALVKQPDEGMGERFEAFVIPKACPTIENKNE